MKFSALQQRAYELLCDCKNVFITGPAGTGKSELLKQYYNRFKGVRSMGFTSTTGTSAIMIGGTTLHSFLGIGLGRDPIDNLHTMIVSNEKMSQRWRTLHALIIDEVSMLSPELFTKLETLARLIRFNDLPFGGIQIILTGDFLQLPCVGSDKFCFQCPAWDKCNINIVYLQKNFRQEDNVFQNCLNEVRYGNEYISDETREILESRINVTLSNDLGILPTKVYSLNKDVDYQNELELDKLAGENVEFYRYEIKYTPKTKYAMKFSKEKLRKMCIAPETLEICVGAQVMLLYNIDVSLGLANGSRGVVTEFKDEYPVVRFLNGVTRPILTQEWKIEDHGQHILSIFQVPLRVAYACTCHKIQGITLDYAIVDLGNVFEYGQGYVALSRVRTLEGLSIKNLDFEKIMAHPDALNFYKELEK